MGAQGDNLSAAQRSRLNQFRTDECVDIHCHCLPALDDGPETMEQAVAICRLLVDDGVTTVIATPHQLGRYCGRNAPSAVRQAVRQLNAQLAAEEVPLHVLPGADVRVDERIVDLVETDGILTLADAGSHLLIELPHEAFVDCRSLARELTSRGLKIVLSHPERQAWLARQPQAVYSLATTGVVFQVTAASLLGEFGPAARDMAWHLLVTFGTTSVATDTHDTDRRPPCLTAAIDLIVRQLGFVAARRACIENPVRILAGRATCPSGKGISLAGPA